VRRVRREGASQMTDGSMSVKILHTCSHYLLVTLLTPCHTSAHAAGSYKAMILSASCLSKSLFDIGMIGAQALDGNTCMYYWQHMHVLLATHACTTGNTCMYYWQHMHVLQATHACTTGNTCMFYSRLQPPSYPKNSAQACGGT